jgi:hypothetical protein
MQQDAEIQYYKTIFQFQVGIAHNSKDLRIVRCSPYFMKMDRMI